MNLHAALIKRNRVLNYTTTMVRVVVSWSAYQHTLGPMDHILLLTLLPCNDDIPAPVDMNVSLAPDLALHVARSQLSRFP